MNSAIHYYNALLNTKTILVFENALFSPQTSKIDTETVTITTNDFKTLISVAAAHSAEITIIHFSHSNIQTQTEIQYSIGENATLQITEIHSSFDKLQKTTSLKADFLLEKNARCEYANIQNLDSETICNQVIAVNQAQNSFFTAHVYQLQGEKLQSTLTIEKNGTQANTALYGLSYPKFEQQFEFVTLVKHNSTDCETLENFKIIASDNSVGIFDGMIYVAPHAAKTLAKQSNKNILLSPNAQIFSKPQLEIYADDVSCNHGSSTGQLNEDALWYLQARGIAPAQARQLLIQAFMNEIIEFLPNEKLRELVNSIVK